MLDADHVDAANTADAVPSPVTPSTGSRLGTVIWVNLAVLFLWQNSLQRLLPYPALRNWSTVFLATMLQALPFLVLGVVVGAGIAAFVPAVALARTLPRRVAFAVPTAGLAGAVLPGCECSAAPVAKRLVGRGVEPAVALTFLLAAPAINPIVLVATAVAFPRNPEIVWARFLASFITAVVIGWIWSRSRGERWMKLDADPLPTEGPLGSFVDTAMHDFLQAGGYLVVGAALVATMQTAVPGRFLDRLGGSGLLAVLTMAALAVALSVCSEADAFIAAGFTHFSLTARLTFLVVGPMIDLKLIALQVAVFGRSFATRFAPLVFVAAVISSLLIGRMLL
jgi:uncharacterized membrane protein YraQ (UPF0718 family)